jgi:hypothetical protein
VRGLSVRLELYGSLEAPMITLAFASLQINTGVASGALRLDVPEGTRAVSVDVDLGDPEWEDKMEDEDQALTQKTAQSGTGQ